jgi:hypothetical protein
MVNYFADKNRFILAGNEMEQRKGNILVWKNYNKRAVNYQTECNPGINCRIIEKKGEILVKIPKNKSGICNSCK